MKDLTFIDLLNEIAEKGSAVQVFQERTRGYAEGVGEPKWYQVVRDAKHQMAQDIDKDSLDPTGLRLTGADALVNRYLKIPWLPPEPKRPGVGVVMVDSRDTPYPALIIEITGKGYTVVQSDGSTATLHLNSFWRPATDEEIVEFIESKGG